MRKLLFALILMSLPTAGLVTNGHADEGFAQNYRAYQSAVRDGKASFDKKDFQSAITHYSKAIGMSPFESSNYNQRGIAYYRLGKYREGISDFDRVIILGPRMGTAYTYRGLCKVNLGEHEEALSDYRKALQLNPKDMSVHNNLALLYATAKDDSLRDNLKAFEHAVKASEISNEKNAEILDTLALVYFVNGRAQEAAETQKKALKLEPGNERFKENLKKYEGAAKKNGG